MPNKNMQVTVVKFRRTQKSKFEKGLMLGWDKLIIDRNYKPVKRPVWDYHTIPTYGHVSFSLD